MDLQIKFYLRDDDHTPAMQNFAKLYNADSSKALWNTVLKVKGETWTNFTPWKLALPEKFFSGCLAGGDSEKDAELMYLETKVNGLKGIVSRCCWYRNERPLM